LRERERERESLEIESVRSEVRGVCFCVSVFRKTVRIQTKRQKIKHINEKGGARHYI